MTNTMLPRGIWDNSVDIANTKRFTYKPYYKWLFGFLYVFCDTTLLARRMSWSYMSSLRIYGGLRIFHPVSPLYSLPRIFDWFSGFLLMYMLFRNKIVCFNSNYGLSKTINWHQFAQNDHRRQLRPKKKIHIW